VKYLSKPRGSFLKSGTQEIRNFVFEKTEIGRCRDSNQLQIADFGIIYRRDKYIRVSR
jgi:hypothetical protein